MAEMYERYRAYDLAARILAGDEEAELELFRRYGPALMRMLQALTHNRWHAEDVHQETFAIVLRRLRRRPLEQPELLGAFLRQTARNLLRIANRRRHRRGETDADESRLEELIDPAPGQLMSVIREEEGELVRRAIAGVRPVRYRQLLSRFYLEEEAKERICEDMGMTATHFNRVLFRARRNLLRVVTRDSAGVRQNRGQGQ